MSDKPRIYTLLANPLSGAEIEARSFAAIDAEAPEHSLSPEQWARAARPLRKAQVWRWSPKRPPRFRRARGR